MNTKILIFVCFAISSCLSAEDQKTITAEGGTTAPATSPPSVASASESTSTGNKDDTAKLENAVVPESTPATSSTITEKPPGEPANPPSVISSNPQKERDLSVTSGKCFTLFEKIRNDTQGNLSPEKLVLSVSGSLPSSADYCKQQTQVTELNSTCSNLSSPVNDSDRAIASVSTGLTALFNVVCSSSSNVLKALADQNGECDTAVKRATEECSKIMNTTATPIPIQYPSDVIYNMMTLPASNCSSLKDAKSCVSNALKKGSGCSEEQQTAIIALVDPIMTVPCMPAASASETTTTTTTVVPSTTPRARNAAAHFQSANLFVAVLPVLLLVFNY